MRLVEAVWENRNLGTSCREIYIEKEDTPEEIRQYVSGVPEAYQVLFLPIERSELLLTVQDCGFSYIESNFDLVRKCKGQQELPKTYERILAKVSSRQLVGDEIEIFLENLRDKYFFDKDKISIDPHFSEQASANRNYWRTKDFLEENRDLRIYEALYGEKAIGYFILEVKDKNIVDVYLSGLYPDCREMNLGTCIMGAETREAMRLGAKTITTGVSLNNFSCLRVYQSLGYEISKSTNIFIKHRKEG